MREYVIELEIYEGRCPDPTAAGIVIKVTRTAVPG